MAPLGTYTKAMRRGTLRSALANTGPADSNVGSAMLAPSPRNTWRRERESKRSAAREGCLLMSAESPSIGRGHGGPGAHLLERRGVDHAHQQRGKAAVIAFEALHDAINGLHI